MTLLLSASPLFADGFLTLNLGVDARTTALGGGGVALANHGSGGYYNPALLTGEVPSTLVFTHHNWIQGVRANFLGLGRGKGQSGWGVYLLYTEIGDMEYRTRPTPEPEGEFSANDLAAGVSYAHALTERFSVGLSVKMLYKKLFVYDAFGAAADLGIAWETGFRDLRIAATVAHLGQTGNLVNKPISLPVRTRVGICWPLRPAGRSLIITTDAVIPNEEAVFLSGGAELYLSKSFMVRGGFQLFGGRNRISGGIGMRLGKARIDYSFMPVQEGLGSSHMFSVHFSF